MANDGPKRRAPPARVKKAVRERQKGKCGCRARCGAVLPPDGKGLVQYQHDPALGIRPVNEAGTDWIPPQHDPDHLFAELVACHLRETNEGRSGATSIGSDRHAIDKVKRAERPPKPKRHVWRSTGMGKRPPGAGNGFPPRGSTPMRRKT